MSKKHFLLLSMAALLFTSCCTLVNGTKAKLTVKSDDVTTPVTLTYDGKTETNIFLPYEIKIKRGSKPTVVTAEAKGYEKASVSVKKKFNAMAIGNIIFGGIPGIAVDAGTGAWMKPETKEITIPFKPVSNIEIQEPAIQTSENTNERVSRDNVGETSLERTIIRWYLDSAPRGSRIFWRVISSVPDEVKNTNELYLGTTPYEETRSFNILGLTYANSRDIQIEIKMRRPGYMEQTKRFNVRQAIDQQEISSFFELVKE